ncbi:MAG: hypothetical protein AB3N20_08105 [Rhizobiaceae bacterium]
MKTSILFLTAAFALAPLTSVAGEIKAESDSIYSIDSLPAESYTSASITAFGEPPKKEKEVKRRFEVGFVPKIPPAPNAETDDDDRAAATNTEMPVNADMGEGVVEPEFSTDELKGTSDGDKTASIVVEGGEHQIGAEGTELRSE